MHLIFLLTYSPKFDPPESGQGFSMQPFSFALEAIKFQKIHLNFLTVRKSFAIQNWIVKDFLKKIEMDFLKFNRL